MLPAATEATAVATTSKVGKGSVMGVGDVSTVKEAVAFSLTIKEAKHKEIHEIYNKICELPNVLVVIRTFGSQDMIVLVPVRDFEELFQFQEYVCKIDGVEKVDVTIYKPHKSWPPQISDKFMQHVEKNAIL